ncbi:DUF1660 family phage protein [Methylomicrobium agile]
MWIVNKIACRIFGHRWKFKRISLEGTKVFICERCGKFWEV